MLQVSVRREAKSVGMASLRRAAWSRNREESLVEQRRHIAAELNRISDLESFATQLAKPLPLQSQGRPLFIIR